MMNDKDKKQPNTAKATLSEEEVQEEEGRELCPKCGNIMVEEGGEKTCSSCSEDIDFFGEDEESDKSQTS